MGEKNRHFSREFKRDAVLLFTEKGMRVGQVARELDIHPNLLHLCRRRFLVQGNKAFVGRGRVRPDENLIMCPLFRGKVRAKLFRADPSPARLTPL